MTLNRSAAAAAAAFAFTMGAVALHAQETAGLERLPPPKGAGASEAIPAVPQTGAQANAIRETLKRIRLPTGFRIDLYAVVPGARNMTVGPSTGVVFVGTRKTRVWAVTDRDGDHAADDVTAFAPWIDFNVPNGVALSNDGSLYVAELNRLLVFPGAEAGYRNPGIAAFGVVPQGKLIPPAEESQGHGARVIKQGPDGKLYITLGQPYNVPPAGKLALYVGLGMGGIIRLDPDGTHREVFARGARNPGGIAFHASGALWWNDHQVDGMGDTIPPGETNISTKAGQHFGFPWYGGGTVRTADYQASTPPPDAVLPVLEHDAHAADMGAMFYTGKQFPEAYRGGYFWAQHGSWNRSDPIGARVMWVPVKDGKPAGKPAPFAEGWMADTGKYFGRPVDVAMLDDGSMLVSDDLAGAIYRIWYVGK